MKRAVIHPLLFAAFPVLFLYSRNVGQIPLWLVVRPLVVLTAIALLLGLGLTVLLKNAHKAGILVSAVFLIAFAHGELVGWMGKHLAHLSHETNAQAALIAGLAFLLIAWKTLQTKRALRDITVLLNLIGLFTVGILLPGATYQHLRGTANIRPVALEYQTSGVPTNSAPDIYYIILDGYARADVLEKLYACDNSSFLDYLRDKGFRVCDRSRSNYCQTGLSLASSLNYCYLDDLARRMGKAGSSRLPLSHMIKHSRVNNFLQEHGYSSVAFATGYPLTEMPRADRYIHPRFALTQFENTLLNTTILPAIDYQLRHRWGLAASRLAGWRYNLHRKWILHTLDEIGRIEREGDKPFFVFAHIMCPHPPFVFDEQGAPINPPHHYSILDANEFMQQASSGGKQEYITGYRQQLLFLDSNLKDTIEHIIAASERPPVIILQADHGPGLEVDLWCPEKTNMEERMAIFNAYYLPGVNAGTIPGDITPVNSFRVVFNSYFRTDLEILPNESYYSTWLAPYDFIRVTEQITSGGDAANHLSLSAGRE